MIKKTSDMSQVRKPRLTLAQRLRTYSLNRRTIHGIICKGEYDKLTKYYNYNLQDLIDHELLEEILINCKSSQVLCHVLTNSKNMDCKNKDHESLLQLLIRHRSPLTVTLYLIEESTSNQLEYSHWKHGKPIHYACRYGCYAIIEKLISKGVNLECWNLSGFFPMYIALLHQNMETIELLLDNVQDVNKQIREGLTPLRYACWHGNIQLIELITRYDPRISGYSQEISAGFLTENKKLTRDERKYAKGLLKSLVVEY